MRLLHTSDWHIGRQLHGVSLLEDQAYVLNQIVEIAEREAVDAVLIAGDVYDRAVPPADAVKLLGQTLKRLCIDLDKQVIMIAGNHDSGERLGFGAELMGSAGLHIIGPLEAELVPITLDNNGMSVDIFGIPYAGPLTVRQIYGEDVSTHEAAMTLLLEHIQQKREPGRPTIVVSHCFVDGAVECESERPLSVGGADKVNAALFEPFTYAALGHLHGQQYRSHKHIRYSGSILKYSFSEVDHRKSVSLVDIAANGSVDVAHVELEALRDLRVVEGRLEDILKNGATDTRPQDFILARLTNTDAVLDVMGKLRNVYPNILQMQNMGLKQVNASPEASREMLRKSHMNLFDDFFAWAHSEALSESQRTYMTALLEQMDEESRV